ncbi:MULTISPECIES: hypothetical protein [Lysobacter]|uniref:Uncharacterized protein n=1 Tax=Lysobacter firmicutimachus TaxID=1792846 RepID=A0ABU8D6K0_9GAMM|nr:hypothetical protein [Lysobacter antibioticus]
MESGTFCPRLPWTAALALALIAAPALAGEGYVIHREGAKPKRSLIYADAGSVEPALTLEEQTQLLFERGPDAVEAARAAAPRALQLIEVREHRDAPDKLIHELQIDCAAGRVRVIAGEAHLRNDTRRPLPARDWAPASAGWLQQAQRFACEPAARDAAHGMQVLSQPIGLLDAVDRTWAEQWPDGRRPPYTGDRSEAAVQAQEQKIDQAISQLSSSMEQLRSNLQAQERDASEQAAQAARQAERRAQTPAPALEQWIEAPVQLLVGTWGEPKAYRDEADARWLDYVIAADGGASSARCSVHFLVRDGRVRDYQTGGSSAHCRQAQLPPGPSL